nr:hypothetical protein [Tanacetum cinerariifolium]
IQGKGKEKVSDEQVARDLLTLQTPKKKSPTDQFIFQRHTSTPTESSGHDESSSLYAELGLTDSEIESDEEVSGINAGVQDAGQAGLNLGSSRSTCSSTVSLRFSCTLGPPVTKPALSQQPKPKPATAKSQEKKRKLVTETSDKPSPAKRSKPGLVTKRRKPTSSLRLVDESIDEGIPEKEPRFDDEETNLQREVEESLKSIHYAPWGPLLPVVIIKPDSRKFQPIQ